MVLGGFIAGVIATCFLSVKASHSLLDLVSLSYQQDQREMAIQSKLAGNYEKSIRHYKNLVESSSADGLPCFDQENQYWDFAFPFSSLILTKISTYDTDDGEKRSQGINLALLAYTLDAGGQPKEAKDIYNRAALLLGYNDVDKLKEFAAELMSSEELLFKNR
jgi:tetratricopeptide (TPR) repeat protein